MSVSAYTGMIMKTIQEYFLVGLKKAKSRQLLADELGISKAAAARYVLGNRPSEAETALALALYINENAYEVVIAAEIARAKAPHMISFWTNLAQTLEVKNEFLYS